MKHCTARSESFKDKTATDPGHNVMQFWRLILNKIQKFCPWIVFSFLLNKEMWDIRRREEEENLCHFPGLWLMWSCQPREAERPGTVLKSPPGLGHLCHRAWTCDSALSLWIRSTGHQLVLNHWPQRRNSEMGYSVGTNVNGTAGNIAICSASSCYQNALSRPSLSSSYSIFPIHFPGNVSEKAADDGQSTLDSVTHVGGQDGAPGFGFGLALTQPLQLVGRVNQWIENLSICIHVFIFPFLCHCLANK